MTGTSSKVKQNCHDTDIIITKILMIMINAMIINGDNYTKNTKL